MCQHKSMLPPYSHYKLSLVISFCLKFLTPLMCIAQNLCVVGQWVVCCGTKSNLSSNQYRRNINIIRAALKQSNFEIINETREESFRYFEISRSIRIRRGKP